MIKTHYELRTSKGAIARIIDDEEVAKRWKREHPHATWLKLFKVTTITRVQPVEIETGRERAA